MQIVARLVKEMNGNVLIRAKCMGMTTIVNIRAAASIEVRTIE